MSGPVIGGRVRNRRRPPSDDRHSDWAVTVAANVTMPRTASIEARFSAMDRMARAVQDALMDPEVLGRVIIFRHPDGIYRPAPDRFDELQSTFADISGEIGGRRHNIHAHGTFQVKHKSNIRLDQTQLKKELRPYLEKEFDMKGYPYVRVDLLKDPKEAWEKYQEKQQRLMAERQRMFVGRMMGVM